MTNSMIMPMAIGGGTAILGGAALPMAAEINTKGLSAFKSISSQQKFVTAVLAGTGMVGAFTSTAIGGTNPSPVSWGAGVIASTAAGAGVGLLFGALGAKTGAVAGLIGGIFGATGATLGGLIN